MENNIQAAFETWRDGINSQKSALYLLSEGNDVKGFVNRHFESGTFAKLHTFECEEEAKREYFRVIV